MCVGPAARGWGHEAEGDACSPSGQGVSPLRRDQLPKRSGEFCWPRPYKWSWACQGLGGTEDAVPRAPGRAAATPPCDGVSARAECGVRRSARQPRLTPGTGAVARRARPRRISDPRCAPRAAGRGPAGAPVPCNRCGRSWSWPTACWTGTWPAAASTARRCSAGSDRQATWTCWSSRGGRWTRGRLPSAREAAQSAPPLLRGEPEQGVAGAGAAARGPRPRGDRPAARLTRGRGRDRSCAVPAAGRGGRVQDAGVRGRQGGAPRLVGAGSPSSVRA